MENITIKGASLHNLKNIDVSIPKNKITVITGVSGSGKSSLAYDIIFEEGHRQYLKSLGILVDFDEEIKFESITGIAPTIAVQQNIIRQNNPRTTVGTKTKIINLLALLYASEGDYYCSVCNKELNENLECPECSNTEEKLPVGYFLSNNSHGMCMTCSGKGSFYEINMDKLLANENTTLEDICLSIGITPGLTNVLRRNFKDYMEMPFVKLPDEVKQDAIYGHFVNGNYKNQSFCLTRFFEGELNKGNDVEKFYSQEICTDC